MSIIAQEEKYSKTFQYRVTGRILDRQSKESKVVIFEIIISRSQFLKMKREGSGMIHVPFYVK